MATAGVERTDSQRSQGNGPRVSFNRDVHVKRIASRPNDQTIHYPQSIHAGPSPLRRELPNDLSEEQIRKEAELVLSQAERVRCTANGGSEITGGRLNAKTRGRIERLNDSSPEKFHSFPTRRKTAKPVIRSVSDASAKKTKKPSIFNLFGASTKKDVGSVSAENQENQLKKVQRSKSDVGTAAQAKERPVVRKRNNSENEEPLSTGKKKPVPLSPIIENPPREQYFTPQTTNKYGLVTAPRSSQSPAGNIGFTSQEDLDLVPSKASVDSPPPSVQPPVSNPKVSADDMHSSQLPAEKPRLTKGVTVDGIVKRLSMERFSPLPHMNGPAFSYTRPNDNKIIYAQVVCDGDGKPKQTVHSSFTTAKNLQNTNSSDHGSHSSQPYRDRDTGGMDTVDSPVAYKKYNGTSHSNNNILYRNVEKHERSHSPVQHLPAFRRSAEPYHPRAGTNYKINRRPNSDEDEGLGFDVKREFDEPPIVPIIRDVVSPVRIQLNASNRGTADGIEERRHEPFPEFNELSNRRKQLESRIFSRRIGSAEHIPNKFRTTVDDRDRYSPPELESRQIRSRSSELLRSPDREIQRIYPTFEKRVLLHKYSPERSHLDMTSPSREMSQSKVVEETKYYYDGSDGYREKYKRETVTGSDGVPHTREHHSRNRLESPSPVKSSREIDLGYIEDNRGEYGSYDYHPHIEPDSSYFQDKYRQEFEPKSLDSQFSDINRSSPEAREVYHHQQHQYRDGIEYSDHFGTLKREKKQQRSFDKGDSGIENDYRKDSFNEDIGTKRWRRRTPHDDIIDTDLFLKRERQHTEKLNARRYDYRFRERSIDDGSHYDPRLDKYPMKYKQERVVVQTAPPEKTMTLRGDIRKMAGLEKVKQLFTGVKKDKKPEVKKEVKDKYMVREDEMRQRYHEYRGGIGSNGVREPKLSDIATRRRLSTPKASPLPKRTPSQKSTKSSSTSLHTTSDAPTKLGWFKSLDRLSRKKSHHTSTPKLDTSTTATEDEFSTLRSQPRSAMPPKIFGRTSSGSPHRTNGVQKSLRFFGDTDMESVPSMSKATLKSKSRHPVPSPMARTQKYSQSAYDLNTLPKRSTNVEVPPEPAARYRSASLQNLERDQENQQRYNGRYESSRHLHDISESASDNENDRGTLQKMRSRSSPVRGEIAGARLRNGSSSRQSDEPDTSYRGGSRERGRERERSPRSPVKMELTGHHDYRKPPTGPQKPARSMDRRKTMSRDRDRVIDSSGTEGDSSQQSQRSVVYLHATTVGAIPQPYVLNARRAASREELSSIKSSSMAGSKQLEPMTRTVSRSVSVLAPWKPKYMHEGYEINYSQNADKQKTLSKSRKDRSSSLNRMPRKHSTSRTDVSSVRNSSLTSNSTATLPSRSKERDQRKGILSKQRKKEMAPPIPPPPAAAALITPPPRTARRRWNE